MRECAKMENVTSTVHCWNLVLITEITIAEKLTYIHTYNPWRLSLAALSSRVPNSNDNNSKSDRAKRFYR